MNWKFLSAFFLAFALLMGSYFLNSREAPYVHPQISASPYVPPLGCDQRHYESGASISSSCADEGYKFDDWRQYGLPAPGRYSHDKFGHQCGAYYRVGRDLLALGCKPDGMFVRYVERLSFI